jgi:hypothetical protein
MNEPNDRNTDEQFARQAKELFDKSVERLDAAALSRLNQGRHNALEALQGRRPAALWGRWLLPAAGVAAVALVTVLVMRGPEPVTLPTESLADFEILLEDESLEMFEDLEFYSWLESTDLDTYGNAG